MNSLNTSASGPHTVFPPQPQPAASEVDTAAAQDAAPCTAEGAARVTDITSMRDKVLARRDEETKGSDNGGGGHIGKDFVLRCLDANELGDGMLFAAVHRDKFVYNNQAAEWMRWVGHHWEWDEMVDVETAVEDMVDVYLRVYDELADDLADAGEEQAKYIEGVRERLLKRVSRLRSVNGRQKCLRMAYTNRERIAIRGDEIDHDPWLLACANGVLDLRTGLLKPGRPGDYIVKASPVEWEGIDAPCPIWEKALLEIMDGDEEMVAYLARLFGYGITGLTSEHVFAVLHGQGRNGKSLLVETISEVVGSLAGPIPAEMLLDQGKSRSAAGPSPDIMALRGLRLSFASETDDGCKFSPSRVKWFSGGDSLTGRYPHDKRLVTFGATHLLLLLTNHKPHAPADDFAFWERLHLVPFELSFVDRKPSAPNERPMDKRLQEKVMAEAPGILAWLVRGCIDWQKNGLNPPPKVLEATAEYRKDEDLLSDFVEECCEEVPDSRVVAKELYDAFLWWFRENVSSSKSFPQKTFGRLMGKRFDKRKVGGKVWYFGVRVRQEVLEEVQLLGGFK